MEHGPLVATIVEKLRHVQDWRADDWTVFLTALAVLVAIVGILVMIILHCLSKRNNTPPPPPEPPQPPPAKPIDNLAEAGQSPNPHFTGRDDVFNKIKETFAKGNTISLTQSISGLGGIGKTAIALQYCYRHKNDYACCWWINAETENGIIAAYSHLAIVTALPVASKPDASPEEIVVAVKHWLQEHDDWLLVFDNAEPFFPAKGEMAGKPLRHYLPGQSDGRRHVLITSRNPNWSEVAEPITIGVFSDKEASAFFHSRTNLEPDEAQWQLAAELGYLALALEQAGAYIAENNHVDYQEYLRLFRQYRLAMFKEKTNTSLPPQQTVNLTWEISIKKINSVSAKELLNCCAFLAPDNIQLRWLVNGRKHLPASLQNDLAEELRCNRMVKALSDYSLVTVHDGDGGLSLHRLVQEIVRESLGKERDKWRDYCLAALNECCFYDFSTVEARREFQRLVPHIEAVANPSHGMAKEQKTLAGLYHFLGYGFDELPDNDAALRWYHEALAIREKVLGTEHPYTATTYNNIAVVYKARGDYAKALELYDKALAISEKVLGTGHPDTATSYNNIALVYQFQGDYAKALELYDKALAIREKVLGTEHPDTATSYNNIAGVYKYQGDSAKALELYDKALAIREKVLGTEHPATADTYNDIGWVYQQAHGDYAKALELYDKALAIREKVLGTEHPDTANTYNNIAVVYQHQGDYAKALEFFDKALDIHEKVLGTEHPHTATSYHNIAWVYEAQGKHEQARDLRLKAYKIRLRKLSAAHPYTKDTLNSLRRAHKNTGNPQPFDEWLRQALAGNTPPPSGFA